MSAHHCHAAGCDSTAPPRLLMCPHHWRMVPKATQRALLRAVAGCVTAVAVHEGKTVDQPE